MGVDNWKKIAGEYAAQLVKDGMVVGLGTGSTVKHTIKMLGEMELKIRGVATSRATERLAKKEKIRLVHPNDAEWIDIAIDGADQVGPKHDLIKGGGGAHTREKIIAAMARRFVVVVDEGKIVPYFTFPVPVEVMEFNLQGAKRSLEKIGGHVIVRKRGDGLFRTDNGNRILDVKFGSMPDAGLMEKRINNIPGVIENGIFPRRYVSEIIIGGKKGVWRYESG